jgi:hypothetical protein
MHTVHRSFGIALCALLLAGATLPARAAVIFNYTAVCTLDCGAIGLAPGDTVSARFGFADAAVVPGATLDEGDVESFSATFGSATFGLSSLILFLGDLDATASSMTSFLALGGNSNAAFLLASDGGGVNFFLVDTGSGIAEGDSGSILRAPEPATAALLGLACAIVAAMKRRERRPLH